MAVMDNMSSHTSTAVMNNALSSQSVRGTAFPCTNKACCAYMPLISLIYVLLRSYFRQVDTYCFYDPGLRAMSIDYGYTLHVVREILEERNISSGTKYLESKFFFDFSTSQHPASGMLCTQKHTVYLW